MTLLAPEYLTDLDRTLGVLQQIQALFAASGDVSLAHVARLVLAMQQEFGTDAPLESVIQSLLARNVKRQIACRQARTGAVQEVTT